MEIWQEMLVTNASHRCRVIVVYTTDLNQRHRHRHQTMMSKTVDIMLRNSLRQPQILLSTDKKLVWSVFQKLALLDVVCIVQNSDWDERVTTMCQHLKKKDLPCIQNHCRFLSIFSFRMSMSVIQRLHCCYLSGMTTNIHKLVDHQPVR